MSLSGLPRFAGMSSENIMKDGKITLIVVERVAITPPGHPGENKSTANNFSVFKRILELLKQAIFDYDWFKSKVTQGSLMVNPGKFIILLAMLARASHLAV